MCIQDLCYYMFHGMYIEPAVIYNILRTSSYLRIESPVKAPQRLLKEQDYAREMYGNSFGNTLREIPNTHILCNTISDCSTVPYSTVEYTL